MAVSACGSASSWALSRSKALCMASAQSLMRMLRCSGGRPVALRADEVVRVEDDFMKALVPVEIGQVQQRQLGLHRQQQAVAALQFDAGQGAEVLVMQKQHRAGLQAL